jgi:transmembrane sensor
MMSATVTDEVTRQRQELVRWFMRRHDAQPHSPWTAEDERDFQQWFSIPANQQAYKQWQADWVLIDTMPQASAERLRAMVVADLAEAHRVSCNAGRSQPIPQRRWLLTQGLAFAGLAGMTFGGGWLGWRHFQAQPVFEQAFNTRKGQQIEARLPDGSALRLDTATALQVTLFRGRREVRLMQGQAFFAVAHDGARPFVVEAGGAVVTVLGTRFSVRYTPDIPGRDGVEVAVEQGKVRVTRGQGAHDQPPVGAADVEAFDLTAGQILVLPVDGTSPVLRTVSSVDVAAWRNMPLSFSDVSLREAVAEMARYADIGIADIDPAVANLRLSGTFDPRNAAATRQLLANALPVRLVNGARGVEVLPLH